MGKKVSVNGVVTVRCVQLATVDWQLAADVLPSHWVQSAENNLSVRNVLQQLQQQRQQRQQRLAYKKEKSTSIVNFHGERERSEFSIRANDEHTTHSTDQRQHSNMFEWTRSNIRHELNGEWERESGYVCMCVSERVLLVCVRACLLWVALITCEDGSTRWEERALLWLTESVSVSLIHFVVSPLCFGCFFLLVVAYRCRCRCVSGELYRRSAAAAAADVAAVVVRCLWPVWPFSWV